MSDELILGKYKSTDELADAYKALKVSYDELASSKNRFTVPEDYLISDNFKLVDGDILSEAKNNATKYKFTQSQFENNISEIIEKTKNKEDSYKELYANFSNIDILESYAIEDLGLSKKTFKSLNKDDLLALGKLRDDGLKTTTQIGSSDVGMPTKINKDDVYNSYKRLREAKERGDGNSIKYCLNEYTEMVNKLDATG